MCLLVLFLFVLIIRHYEYENEEFFYATEGHLTVFPNVLRSPVNYEIIWDFR